VTVLEAFRILPKDDPELALMLRERLVGDGIAIREQVTIIGVEPEDAGVAAMIESADGRPGTDRRFASARRRRQAPECQSLFADGACRPVPTGMLL
jgi:hypothetical protein